MRKNSFVCHVISHSIFSQVLHTFPLVLGRIQWYFRAVHPRGSHGPEHGHRRVGHGHRRELVLLQRHGERQGHEGLGGAHCDGWVVLDSVLWVLCDGLDLLFCDVIWYYVVPIV